PEDLDSRLDEIGCGVVRRRQRLDFDAQQVVRPPAERDDQAVLRPVHAVHRSRGNPDGVGYPPHRERLEAFPLDEALGGVEQRARRPLSVLPRPCHRAMITQRRYVTCYKNETLLRNTERSRTVTHIAQRTDSAGTAPGSVRIRFAGLAG